MQLFAAAQKAAEALATAINSDPGSVFVTLVKHRVHGKAMNIMILGPSQAASAGEHSTGMQGASPKKLKNTSVERN